MRFWRRFTIFSIVNRRWIIYVRWQEISYDIVGIPCELPREKTLFKHIRESKIQSIDEMEIVKIERKDRCIFILQVIHIGALIVLKIFAMNMKQYYIFLCSRESWSTTMGGGRLRRKNMEWRNCVCGRTVSQYFIC